jgi:hypothetical protein
LNYAAIDEPLLGSAFWLLWQGTPDGWTERPRRWSIPFDLRPVGSPLSSDLYALADLTGDGRADFVVTRRGDSTPNDPLIGRAHWLVYENTGDGFADAPVQWRLPFSLQDGGDHSDLGTNAHTLLDLDGDARPDFVVFRDSELPERDPLIGKAYWRVYPNTGEGFAAESMRYTLPYSLNENTDFRDLGTNGHSVLDLDGDRRPDFVVLNDDELPRADPLIGRAYWRIHRGGDRGFDAEGARWALPYALEEGSRVANRYHGLLDLDANGKLDFVVFQNGEAPEADPLVARNHWLVFANESDGFASESTPWRLPFALDNQSAPGGRRHAVLSLDTPCPRFVVLQNGLAPQADPLIGSAYWHAW